MEEGFGNQFQYILSEIGTKTRELEERTILLRDRMSVINSNFISMRKDVDDKTLKTEKKINEISSELRRIDSHLKSISSEIDNFVKKDGIVLIERMLKDFQPLEFMRRKDVEELIDKKLGQFTVISNKEKIAKNKKR